MADKEATVYIVDVGRSMSEKNGGRQQSDLDYAMQYVWEKITSTVATGKLIAHRQYSHDLHCNRTKNCDSWSHRSPD